MPSTDADVKIKFFVIKTSQSWRLYCVQFAFVRLGRSELNVSMMTSADINTERTILANNTKFWRIVGKAPDLDKDCQKK